MKYESFHFSPLHNRSMLMPVHEKGKKPEPKVRRILAEEGAELVPLGENPYFQPSVGFTAKETEVGGENRTYGVYVPHGMHSKGEALLVFPQSGMGAEEFLSFSNWKALSEQYHVALLILESNGWKPEKVERDFDFAAKVVELEFQQRLTVDICESNLYPIGLGDGAYTATAFALTYSATYPAFAADGDCNVDPDLFDVLRSLPSDGIDTWKKPEIAMPGFIVDRSGKAEATETYMKETIRAKEEGLTNKYGKVYLEQPRRGAYFVNEQPIAQVWLGDKESVKGVSREELNEAMVQFVLRFARWGGFGNNHLRANKTPETTGVERVHREIDGLKRYWDVYKPSCYRPDDGKVYPLVVAIHGFSCNSEYFAETSDWYRLAEERGFFVVFPSGYPIRSGLTKMQLPGWNTGTIGGGEDRDLGYFTALLDDMEASYHIDKKRIYAVGHSNGSMMTQVLARRMPERFAAFGPTGSMGGFTAADVKPLEGKWKRPVWFMLGEYDNNAADMSEEGLIKTTLRAFAAANGVKVQYENWYDNGRYHTLVMYDDTGAPSVLFTRIEGSPHTYTAEMAQLTWDNFLCHYTREEDGSSVYHG